MFIKRNLVICKYYNLVNAININDNELVKKYEKGIYDKNLIIYSAIVRGKIKNKDETLECIRLLEYFEDYEKCEHLANIIKDGNNPK